MRLVKFNVRCRAYYPSSLIIPDDVKEGEELEYIRNNLSNCNVEDHPTFTDDFEPELAVDEQSIKSIEELEDEE